MMEESKHATLKNKKKNNREITFSAGFIRELVNKMNSTNKGGDWSPAALLLGAFIILMKRYTREDEIQIHFRDLDPASPRQQNIQKGQSLKINVDGDYNFLIILKGINQLAQIMFLLDESYECLFSKLNFSVSLIDQRAKHGFIRFSLTSNNTKTVSASINFYTDLQDPQIFDSLKDHYLRILHQSVTYPGRAISKYVLLGKEELHRIFFEWNRTEEVFPGGKCLHHLIEEQVNKAPESCAAIYKGKKLSYRSLNNKANILAHKLISLGVQPDDSVALYLDLSFNSLIAVLGILKAGGAYLPLQLDYPASRIKYILKHAKPKAIITQKDRQTLISFRKKKKIIIDEFDFREGSENPKVRVKPNHLAYIIYTSGSTGLPKGVLIQHDNVVNNIFLIRKRYHLTNKDTVLSMPSLAFDASVSKLFPILTVGGSVVLPTDEESRDADSMLKLVVNYNCPYLAATPSFIRIVNSINPDLSGLRMITSGGETLNYSDIHNINKRVPVLNVYGPTETTVSSCSYLVQKNAPVKDSRVPIGKPNPNCKLYVLDEDMNFMPVGSFGTLYIGGKGVGRGYLNDPELTAQKFVPNPFMLDELLYNSGDIVRWLPDGNLDFLGRKDHQVKLRGYRLSTEEIEENVLSHPKIKECKILLYQNSDRGSSIVAYMVVKKGTHLRQGDIIKFLETRLPAYMIPAEFFILNKLPVNSNNKVDTGILRTYLKNLPGEGNGNEVSTTNLNEAQSVETEIISYCKQLLNKERIVSNDNFFRIGANSLQAMQLKLFIQKRYQVDIPVKAIFENPSMKELSTLIQRAFNTDIQKLSSGGNGRVKQSHSSIQQANNKVDQFSTQRLLPVPNQPAKGGIEPNSGSFLPLSFSEKRVWSLYKLQSNKAVYNIVKAYSIQGRLDIDSLQTSIFYVAQRHNNLRKNFVEIDGEPRAKINDELSIDFRKTDLTNQERLGETRNATVSRIIQEESELPFDLRREWPFRIRIIKVDMDRYILVLSFHQIITDARSFEIFVRELRLIYNSCLSGESLSLPDLHQNYLEYPSLSISEASFRQCRKYWMKHLRDKVNPMNLPYDSIGSRKDEYSGAVERKKIPQALALKINRFSKEKDATVFMTFLASLQSLLHIFTKEENINTAIPISGRQEKTSDLIGFFENTLILSTPFNKNPMFEETLNGVRKKVMEAYKYKDLPYETLVNELKKEKDLKTESFIQIMFAFHGLRDSIQLANLKVEKIPVPVKLVNFDLTISVEEEERGYLISAEYRSNKFKPATIKRLIEYYQRILEHAVNNPKARLSEIDLLNKTEKEIITRSWNKTNRIIPDLPVHNLFELQASITPDELAISYDDRVKLTYGELNSRANQLAHRVIHQKVGSQELVGIYLEDHADAIIAMLAILKAGCAYLPLDPINPEGRLRYLLNTSNVGMIITNKAHRRSIPGNQYKRIYVDESGLDKYAKDNTLIKVDLNHLAYVMFTSGSTGDPKAVGIEHKSIVRLVMNINYLHLGRIGCRNRLLKTSAFSFDASTFEIWGMLLNGGLLYLYPKRSILSTRFLREKIRQNRINVMWLTSSWFNELAEQDPKIFRPLRQLLIGGEKLSPHHINLAKSANTKLEVFNMYGPTENTTFSLFYKIPDNQQCESIPIGKPISNTTVYILDDQQKILPPGIEGEIYLGGEGIARGYLNDPHQTSEKFIPNPFIPGQKLYKTGDFGKWLDNGNVIFCGRKDAQIKLNGYRTEPGEIEHILNQHRYIKESVVVVKDVKDKKQLIAFYKYNEKTPPSSESLRTYLLDNLPQHMIPVQFKPVIKYPLTSNGKIDKQKLLAEATSDHSTEEYDPPESSLEKELATIWENVLGQSNLSVNANFFHLGGHSLLAVKLMSRIEQAFQRKLMVSVLFEAPTIRSLASYIVKENDRRALSIAPIQPAGDKDPLFLIPGYFCYYNMAKQLGNDQPVYGFEPISKQSTEKIARHYIREMLKIQPEGPFLLGGYSTDGIVAYEMARQLKAAGHEIGMLALFETYTPEGTMTKTSSKYIQEKIDYCKAHLQEASLKEKVKVVSRESQKAVNYFYNKLNQIMGLDYTIKPYDGEMILFKATEGMTDEAKDPFMGWSKYCPKENLKVIKVPGNHNTIFKEPHVEVTAEHLKRCMTNIKNEYVSLLQ